jgi:RimJ/RimL family protein N-acetyltransferase
MQTERTILTTLTKDDYTEVLVMYDEPDTFKYIAPLQNKSREELISFLDSRIAQVNDGLGYHWVVRLKENGKFIGLMNLNPIGKSDKIQVGFQLRRKYWNQGFATEVTKLVLEFAVEEAGMRVIYGVFSKRNVVSKKIFERFGFEFEESNMVDNDETIIEIWKYIARHKMNTE